MNTEAERRFWRLLTDYERLAKDESVAIHARDFEALESIQTRKPALLDALCALAGNGGPDRAHPALSARLDALTALGDACSEALATMQRDARTERRNLDAARQRLRGLNTTYGPDPRQQQAFCAHG